MVQFTIKILQDLPQTWYGITQFCHQALDGGYGCRQPHVGYNNNKKKIEFSLFHGGSSRSNGWTEVVSLNIRYDIKVETVLVSGTYYFQAFLNGQLAFAPVVITNPEEFDNLHYLYGNVWQSALNAIEISNLLYAGIED